MISIYTGAIGSGKTTKLKAWISKRDDVCGVMMPVIEGIRHIYSISSQKSFQVEAGEDDFEEDVVRIRKFRFLKSKFEWANRELLKCLDSGCNLIVIDEIGPLELNMSGFYTAVKTILKAGNKDVLMVIREGLVEEVMHFFKIKKFKTVKNPKEMDYRKY